MAHKTYHQDFLELNALVVNFFSAYENLHGERGKSPQEDLSGNAHTPHLGGETTHTPQISGRRHFKPVTTPRIGVEENQMLTTQFERGVMANHEPLSLRQTFDDLETEIAGRLEEELQEESSEPIPEFRQDSKPHVNTRGSTSIISSMTCMSALDPHELKRLQSNPSCDRSARDDQTSWASTKTRTFQNMIMNADREHVTRFAFLTVDPEIFSLHLCQLWRWFRESPGEDLVTKAVEPFMGMFIILNCILIGASLDTEEWEGWVIVDWFFAGLYTLEICVRLWLLGIREMYLGPSWAWSFFDTLIVTVAIVDLLLQFSGSITMFRILRLARLARLVRLIRLPVLRELVMLIRGMMGGARCLLWCMVFLTLPVFIVGMLLSQMLSDWGEDGFFASVLLAMFTTFRCMVGDCTDSKGRPLIVLLSKSRGWHYAFFYSVFMLVITFGIFNLITAIFIESTMQAAKSDTILQSQIRKAEDLKFSRNVKRLIYKLWTERCHRTRTSLHSKRISVTSESKAFANFNIADALDLEIEESFYHELVVKPEIREVLDDMGLHDDVIVDLFDMLDVDRSGTLDFSELVNGLHKLRGEARKSDLVSLSYMIFGVQDSMRELNAIVVQLCEAQGIRPDRRSDSSEHSKKSKT